MSQATLRVRTWMVVLGFIGWLLAGAGPGAAQTPDVSVTPGNDTWTTTKGSTNVLLVFTASNLGSSSVSLTYSCVATMGLSCASVSPASSTISDYSDELVQVRFNAPSYATEGTITFRASYLGQVIASGVYTVTVRGAVPQVTPDGATQSYNTSESPGSANFLIKNVGYAAGTFTLSCSSGSPLTCGTDPQSVTLEVNDTITVTQSFTFSQIGTDTLTLLATSDAETDAGSYVVSIGSSGATPNVTPQTTPVDFIVTSVDTERMVRFTVTNPSGQGDGEYEFWCAPSGPWAEQNYGPGWCTVVPDTTTAIGEGQSASVDVFFTTLADSVGAGTVTLHARVVGDASKEGSGYAVVNVAASSGGGPSANPPIVQAIFPPTSINVGEETTLTFTVTNNNDPEVNGGSITYDLSCSLSTGHLQYCTNVPIQVVDLTNGYQATDSLEIGGWSAGVDTIRFIATGEVGGADTALVVISVLGVPGAPTVTPKGDSAYATVGETVQLPFYVANPGSAEATDTLTCTVTPDIPCNILLSSPIISVQAQDTMQVMVSVPNIPAGDLTVQLRARGVAPADSGWYAVTASALTVNPKGNQPPTWVLADSVRADTFAVSYEGPPALISFEKVCTGLSAGCTGPTPTTATLGGSGSTTASVVVEYQVSQTDTVGKVSLIATRSSPTPVLADTGWVNISLSRLLLSVEDANPGLEELRSECLSVAAGAGNIECDDFRYTYPFLPIKRMNRVRNPALSYSTAVARPHRIIGANLTLPSHTDPTGVSIKARLLVDANAVDSIQYNDDIEAGKPIRFAFEVDSALVSGTALVPYTVQAMVTYPQSAPDTIEVSGQYIQVERREEFGRGWWPAGYEQLTPVGNDTLIWVGGDGSARAYVRDTTATEDTWVANTRGVPDIITAASTTTTIQRDSARYLDVDGTESGSIAAGAHANLQGATQMTWAFWVQSRGYSGPIGGITSGSDPNRVWWFEADNSGSELRTVLFNSAAGDPVFLNATGLTPNTWHFVVAEFDGTQSTDATRFRVWIDGSERSISMIGPAVPTVLATGTAPFEWGRLTAHGTGFNGLLGELAVVRGLLDASEREDWRQNGIGFDHPQLAAGYEWRQSLTDVSALGNDLQSTTIGASEYASTWNYPSRGTPAGGWSGGSALSQPGAFLDLDGSEYGSRAENTYTGLSGGPQMTWAFWVNPTGEGKIAGIRYYSSTDTWSWSIETSRAYGDAIWFVTRNSSLSTTLVESAGLNFNQWNFVVIRFDGTQSTATSRLRIFINGQDRTTYFNGATMPTSLPTVNWPFAVGNTSPYYPGLPGKLGEFAMLPGIVSDSTMADWRQNGIDMTYPGLTAGYKWQGNLTDASSSGNDLTGVNIDAADYGVAGGYPSRGTTSGGGGAGGGGTTAVASYVRHILGGGEVHYSAEGRHIETVDRTGNETVFGHTPFGTETRLTSIDLPTPSGPAPAYQFAYDTTTVALEVVRVIGGDGGWLEYQVATSGSGSEFDIDSLTTPDGLTTGFSYQDGVLGSVTDHRGAETEIGYAHAKVSSVSITTTDPAQTVVLGYTPASLMGIDSTGQYAPAPADTVRAVFNGPRTDVGDSTTFFVNGWGAVRGIVDALGHGTWMERADEVFPRLVTGVRYPNGRETAASYNAATGLLVSITDYADDVATTQYEWDETWRAPTLVRTPEQVVTRFAYDPLTGNRDSTWVGTDNVRFGYNAVGLLDTLLSAEGHLTTFAYDSLGNIESETSALGFVTTYVNDAVGRPVEIRTPTGPDSLQTERVETFLFDAVGRQLRHQSTSTMDGAEAWDSTAYNAFGDRASVMRRGFVAPEAVMAFYGDTTNTVAADAILKPVEWTYDDLGRVKTETTDGVRFESLRYDIAGNVDRILTRGGDTIWMEYDELNRLKARRASDRWYAAVTSVPVQPQPPDPPSWQFPFVPSVGGGREVLGDSAAFVYDEMGALIQATNRTGSVARQYTMRSQLKQDSVVILSPGAGSTVRAVVGFGYDKDGRIDEVRYPGHTEGFPRASTYGYDYVTGRLTSVVDILDNATTYDYDGDGRPIGVLHPGALAESMGYDADGRLTTRSMGAFFVDSLEYDPAGRIVAALQDQGGANALVIENAYDGLGHLTRATDLIRGTQQTEKMVMDGLGNLALRWTSPSSLDPTSNNPIETSSYDLNGRLVHQDAEGPMEGIAGPYPVYKTLTYDLGGEVKTVGSYQFKKYSNGSQDPWLSATAEHNYYDAEGRLRYRQQQTQVRVADPYVHVDHTLGAWEEYRYDALGRRVAVLTLASGVCTTSQLSCYAAERFFVWGGDQLVYEKSRLPASDGLSDERQYGAVYYTHAGGTDQPIGVVHEDEYSNKRAFFPHLNWRGLFVIATDSAGQNCGANSSGSCWGAIWPGNRQNAFRSVPVDGSSSTWFGSLMADQQDVTGLLYRRNRYYDAASGQFTQEDPIGIAGGLNLYGYANGDPINFSDPFGLCTDPSDVACQWFEAGTSALFGSIGTVLGFLGGGVTGGGNPALALAGAAAGGAVGSAAGLALGQEVSPFFFSRSDGGEVRRKPGKLGEFKGRDALRRENRMLRDVVKELDLTRDQQRMLHDEVSGQGLKYQEILDRARDLFRR